MKYLVQFGVILLAIVATAFAVKTFWPSVETKTHTTVSFDTALVHVQAIRIDSLEAQLKFVRLERQKSATTSRRQMESAIAFYQSIIDSLKLNSDSTSWTVPKAYADQNFQTSVTVTTHWRDTNFTESTTFLHKDTTVMASGITHIEYLFPPSNTFNVLTQLNPIEIPYPMIETTIIKTERQISWEWTAILTSVGFAAGMFLARK